MFSVTKTCTGRYGDVVPCDEGPANDCTNEHSIIRFGHNFVEKNGSVAEGLNATDLLTGSHYQVEIEYLTYWEGDKVEEGRPWRSRFSEYILPNLEMEGHNMQEFSTDKCRNRISQFELEQAANCQLPVQ